jgi:hypothetical protein
LPSKPSPTHTKPRFRSGSPVGTLATIPCAGPRPTHRLERSLPLLLTVAALVAACGARTGALDEGVAPGAVSDGGVLDEAVSSDAVSSEAAASDELGLACGPPPENVRPPNIPNGCYQVGATPYRLQYWCCPCVM